MGGYSRLLRIASSDPISQTLPWTSARNFTEEANAPNYHPIFAEQHVTWQEQGGHALNFHQAGFEIAAQEYEPAPRGEVHVAVAQATESSTAEMRERMSVPENQEKQPGSVIK